MRGQVVRTPMIRCEALDEVAGCSVYLKPENLQHVGAFKARGAYLAVSRLDPGARARGIITFSSGNHAQAVAWAARRFGVPATIAMPTDAPPVKVARVRELGAEILFAGTTSDDRREVALARAEKNGAPVVHPFDDPDVIAGQGSATMEFHEDVIARDGAPLDDLLCPVGGGGLLAGACLALEGQPTRIHTVEPGGCDAFAQSFAAGERVAVSPGPTLADGLKPVMVGALNFAIASPRVFATHCVTDAHLADATRAYLDRARLVVEPSGAATLAALIAARRAGRFEGRRVGLLVSGGNLDPALAARLWNPGPR